jgi:hypothetical protein
MRKQAVAAIAVFATLANAAQPLQCTNPDILNGLVFLGRSDQKMTVTRGSPGFLGNFRAPSGFHLIGSGVRGIGMDTVAYKTSLPGDKTYAALLAAFAAEGWEIEATPGAGATFNVAGSPREGTVCRNGERRILLVTEAGGATYASVNTYPVRRQLDCNAPDPLRNMVSGMNSTIPRFQFPVGTSIAQGGFGGGGGSSQSYSTSTRIISPEGQGTLVEQLGNQIERQGWRPDSGWSGANSAGSTWRKTIGGQLGSGTLDIVRVSKDTYEVSFTLQLPQ